jgi:Secretion system C-terminal sorting domain
MKGFTFLFFFLNAFNLFGQLQYNNFETSVDLDITFDTANTEMIWQIGPPQKNLFNTTTSVPNAIMTDTLNTYPNGQESWFEVELSEYTLENFPFVQLEWFQRTDMEENVDGGIIEVSYDGGQTWKNVFDDPDFRPQMVGFFQTGTLFNGKTGITGTQGETWMAICWGNYFGNLPSFSAGIKVRFTFVSDNVDTQQDGWLLDNLYVFGGVIGSTSSLNVSNSIPVYPNPAKEELQIDLTEINTRESQVQVFDATGKKVFEELLDTNLDLHRIALNNFHSGIYFLKIQTDQGFYEQTFVKME